MLNISAGGCAFTVTDPVFAEAPGKAIKVTIDDFSLLQGKPLEGIVIRSTNDEGRYVVGCRLIEDNDAICEYAVSYTHLDVYKRQVLERMNVSCNKIILDEGAL